MLNHLRYFREFRRLQLCLDLIVAIRLLVKMIYAKVQLKKRLNRI